MGFFKKSKKVKPEGDKKSAGKKEPEEAKDDILSFNFLDAGRSSKTPSEMEKGGKTKDGEKDPKKKTGEGEKEVGNGGGVLEDVDEACTLSWKARLIGFCVCALVGIVLVGLGYLCIILHKITAFAVVYSIGSIVAILSTGFLVGPMRQFKLMLQKGRIIFTLVFLLAIVLTIVFGVKKNTIVTIIFMIIQVIAFIVYSLTYMPIVGLWLRKTVGKIIPGGFK